LVSFGERATDKVLQEAADRNGVRVFPKVGVADALDIGSSGLSDQEFRYATRAHFDFVVAEPEGKPYFAVEFDGPLHRTDAATTARDRMKDSIADRLGLPVIRIGADFLHTVGRHTLLGWLIDLWFMQQAYYEAQERGEVPDDEPFVYSSFYDMTSEGKLAPAFDFTVEARIGIERAYERSVTAARFPETVRPWSYGDDEYATNFAILPLSGGGFLIGEGRCRVLTRTSGPMPVGPAEIAHDLARLDLAKKLDAVERGDLLPSTAEQLAALRSETRGWLREGALLDDIPPA
jgi:hypothetical protein